MWKTSSIEYGLDSNGKVFMLLKTFYNDVIQEMRITFKDQEEIFNHCKILNHFKMLSK